MPAPGRGTAVLHVGTVTGAPSGFLVPVTVLGESYDLPCVNDAPPTGNVWVAFIGRTGLVLGPVGSPAALCADPGDWPEDVASRTSTSAAFGDASSVFGYVALSVRVAYTATSSATITPEVRVYYDGTGWSGWESTSPATISSPDSGTVEAWFGGGDNITDIEVRWDVADAFTSLCVQPIDNT